MRDRTSLVLELISNPKTVNRVTQELAVFGWYCENCLAVVTKQNVLTILKQFECGEVSAAEVMGWANALGGRTDISFEFGPDGVVEESMYWLANPEINWPINVELCQRIVALFERRKDKRNIHKLHGQP